MIDWLVIPAAFLGAFAGALVALLILGRTSRQPNVVAVSRETLDRVEEAKAKYGLPDWEAEESEESDTDLSDLSIDPEDSED